jgi:hypothetical protein
MFVWSWIEGQASVSPPKVELQKKPGKPDQGRRESGEATMDTYRHGKGLAWYMASDALKTHQP